MPVRILSGGVLGISPLSSALRPGFARVDHARDVRFFIPLVEAAHAVANDAIGGGDALAGAQKLQPGLHDEGFDEALGLRRVLKDAPADGSVAQRSEEHTSELQ